ncbi:MAG TPA: protein-methionine-sulfoxide reductase heme-binding subunit MsrQ [Candidatus Acidoferrales bacterium]|nr:protein-methionine-sulfoxide reductase heme-binding subunit MsrQ [Candidatus Acidoferrales bacterium]
MLRGILTSRWTKVVVCAASLAPAGRLVWKALHRGLGPNPIEYVTHETGDWILIFLTVTLAITPARKILRLPELIRFRRMVGLLAFFYAFLHFSTWIGLDKFFDLAEMLHDVRKRPFITAGFTGFVLLLPLALTSTRGWIRRLGGKRWQWLHRLIYVSATAGVVHYYWLVKSDVRKPVMYGTIIGLLLAFRAGAWFVNKRRGAPARGARTEELITAETP